MASFLKRKNYRPLRAAASERQCLNGYLLAFFALLALSLLFTATARADLLSADLQAKLTKCQADFRTAFAKSYEARGEWKEAVARCNRNHVSEPQRRGEVNYRFQVSVRALGEKEQKLAREYNNGDGPGHESQDGICERAYEAAEWSLQTMEKQRLATCKQTAEKVNSMADCYEGNRIKKCEKELREIKRTIEADGKHTNDMLKSFADYLESHETNLDNAKKLYDKDIRTLKAQAGPGIVTSIADHGHAATNDDYLALLLKNPQVSGLRMSPAGLLDKNEYGELVQEQLNAKAAILTLAQDMKSFDEKQRAFNQEFLGSVGEYKEPTTDSDWGKYANLAGPASGAVGALSGTNAAASALPLAAAAAGGAATLASAGKSSVGGYGGAGASGTGPAPSETGTSTTGSGPKAAGPGTAPGGLVPLTEIVSKTDTKEEKGRTPSSDTFIPAGKLAASGSSTGLGKEGAAAPAQVGATTAPAGSTDDLLHSFNDAIKPIPAPTKKKDDGLGDMGNIFGQVSKLFNFDAPPGGGEAPPPADMASGDSSSPAGEFNDGFQYGGGASGTYASSGGDETAVPGNLENASPEEREMMQFGSVGTPLFQRVHTRHRLCMEKGLLLQEFGRLPQ